MLLHYNHAKGVDMNNISFPEWCAGDAAYENITFGAADDDIVRFIAGPHGPECAVLAVWIYPGETLAVQAVFEHLKFIGVHGVPEPPRCDCMALCLTLRDNDGQCETKWYPGDSLKDNLRALIDMVP